MGLGDMIHGTKSLAIGSIKGLIAGPGITIGGAYAWNPVVNGCLEILSSEFPKSWFEPNFLIPASILISGLDSGIDSLRNTGGMLPQATLATTVLSAMATGAVLSNGLPFVNPSFLSEVPVNHRPRQEFAIVAKEIERPKEKITYLAALPRNTLKPVL